MRLPHWALIAACLVLLWVCAYLLAFQPQPDFPIRNAYYPFTVEVEVWDVGASPWDSRERPTDLDKPD